MKVQQGVTYQDYNQAPEFMPVYRSGNSVSSRVLDKVWASFLQRIRVGKMVKDDINMLQALEIDQPKLFEPEKKK